jgi:hypothetical protein
LQEAVVFGTGANGSRTSGKALNPFVNPAHAYDRAAFLTARRRARLVDAPAAGEDWVHFSTDIKTQNRPLFAHWYTLFFFEDYATVKRNH